MLIYLIVSHGYDPVAFLFLHVTHFLFTFSFLWM